MARNLSLCDSCNLVSYNKIQDMFVEISVKDLPGNTADRAELLKLHIFLQNALNDYVKNKLRKDDDNS